MVAILALLAGSLPAWPQFPSDRPTELSVRIALMDDRPAPSQLRVQLLTSSELQVNESFTDETGFARFSVRPGNYRIRVTGMQIEETVSSVFSISRVDPAHIEFVRVRLLPSKDGTQPPSTGLVSLTQMNIPDKARKEYEKAGKAMQGSNWAEARLQLEKAIALYPQFAAAWNDLGVVHMNSGDRAAARAAFEKAIEFDPNYPRAHRNLAMLTFSEGRNDEAAALLEKTLASDPLDPQALTLMAQLQLLAGKTEAALANARKVHSVPHEGQAVAHYIAARALEARNLPQEAAAEYRLFLQEAPNSASAPKARAALDKLTTKAN
jgi:tetratricopeptide (TPR) repeat protein